MGLGDSIADLEQSGAGLHAGNKMGFGKKLKKFGKKAKKALKKGAKVFKAAAPFLGVAVPGSSLDPLSNLNQQLDNVTNVKGLGDTLTSATKKKKLKKLKVPGIVGGAVMLGEKPSGFERFLGKVQDTAGEVGGFAGALRGGIFGGGDEIGGPGGGPPAEIQGPPEAPASGLPSWAIPAAIGGGLLLLVMSKGRS